MRSDDPCDVLNAIPTIRYEDHPAYATARPAGFADGAAVYAPLGEIEEAYQRLVVERVRPWFWQNGESRKAGQHQQFLALASAKFREFGQRLRDSRTDWTAHETERVAALVARLEHELKDEVEARWREFYHSQVRPHPSEELAGLDRMRETGFAAFRLDRDDVAHMRRALAAHDQKLRAFDTRDPDQWAVVEVDLQKEIEFANRFRPCVERLNLLGLASQYMRRPMHLAGVYLNLSRTHDQWWRARDQDVGLGLPKTVGMHYDSCLGLMKCMMYLSDVGQGDGPFSYLPGTVRAHTGLMQRLSGKAMPYAKIGLDTPDSRRLFLKLPAGLRNYSHFGDDLLCGSDLEAAYHAREHQFLSADANVILFDNYGLHRGGMVEGGERLTLQLLLRPEPLPVAIAAAA